MSAGLGDIKALIADHRSGAIVRATTDEALDGVVDQIADLLADSGTAERCRAVAEAHFNLDRAVDGLVEAYHHATAG